MTEKSISKIQSPASKRRNKILQWWFFIWIGLWIFSSLIKWLTLEGLLWSATGWAIVGIIIALIVATIVNAINNWK